MVGVPVPGMHDTSIGRHNIKFADSPVMPADSITARALRLLEERDPLTPWRPVTRPSLGTCIHFPQLKDRPLDSQKVAQLEVQDADAFGRGCEQVWILWRTVIDAYMESVVCLPAWLFGPLSQPSAHTIADLQEAKNQLDYDACKYVCLAAKFLASKLAHTLPADATLLCIAVRASSLDPSVKCPVFEGLEAWSIHVL